MKIGLIVECGPKGAETKVIPHLVRVLNPLLDIDDPVPLDDKNVLRRECGSWARTLLDRGCDRVLILWDLLPDWGEDEGKGCRHKDREEITKSLTNAGVNPADKRIRLVCVEKMLESWILADNQAVADFLSTDAHKVRVSPCKHPDAVKDPEAVLNRAFRETRFRKYRDLDDAFKIIKVADLSRLRRSESFRRFEAKLTQ